jgi:hypothetical protein
MRARTSLPLSLASTLVLAAGAASAATHARTGLCAGFGLGLESVSWKDDEGDRSAEASGSLGVRAGYAARSDLVVGVEFWGWAKEYAIQSSEGAIEVDVRLTATSFAATYFPGNAGFFLRLCAGLAYGTIDFSSLSPSAAPVSESEAGVAVLFCPGYEFRLTPRFALGAQGDIVYLGLDTPLENGFGYGLSARFNWYW